MSDIAIKIEHLTKVYKIFDKPTDRVKEALNPFGKRYSKDFYALNDLNIEIKKGDVIGQAIFQKYLTVDNDKAEGERVGGFGSTSK